MKELKALVQQHETSFRNALIKGIQHPVDLKASVIEYRQWRALQAAYQSLLREITPNWSAECLGGKLPAKTPEAHAANMTLERGWGRAQEFLDAERDWDPDVQAYHQSMVRSMPARRIHDAILLLEGVIPDAKRQLLEQALVTMARNQELNRTAFWVKGSYDQGDGHHGAFLVEASDGSEAMSIVNDYCDRLGDGATPITGAPDSWTFVPETHEGDADLLDALANMQYPVLSREAISEN